jgi:hypothetical protein
MIFRIFSPKKFGEKIAFFLNLLLVFAKNYQNIGFGGKRQFFAENWQKLQKLVIITSTPAF